MKHLLSRPGRASRPRPVRRRDARRRPATGTATGVGRRARVARTLRSPSTVGALVLILLTTAGAVAVATNRSSTGVRASVQAQSVWLTTGPRGSLTRVEAATGRPTAVLYPWQPGEVPENRFALAGTTLLVLDADGRLVVWDQAAGTSATTVDLPGDLAATRVLAADGQAHLLGDDGTVETRDLARITQPGQRTRLPGTPEQALAVGDTLWVRLAGVGAVAGVRDGDLLRGPQRCTGECTLLAADGRAYLASGATATGLDGARDWPLPAHTDPGRLRPEPGTATAAAAGGRIVELTGGRARRSAPIPDGDAGAPLITGDLAYLPTADGAVLAAPLGGAPATRIPVAGPGPVELVPAGLRVLAHDPGSDRVVVIDGVRAHAGSKHDEQVPVIGSGPRTAPDGSTATPGAATPRPPDDPATPSAPKNPLAPGGSPAPGDPTASGNPQAPGAAGAPGPVTPGTAGTPPTVLPPTVLPPAPGSPATPATPAAGPQPPVEAPGASGPEPAGPGTGAPSQPAPEPAVQAAPASIAAPQVTVVTAGPGWIEVAYRLVPGSTVTGVTVTATAPGVPPTTTQVAPDRNVVRLAVGPCNRYEVTVTATGPAGSSAAPPVPAVACAELAPPTALLAVPDGGGAVRVTWQPPAGIGPVTHRVLATVPVPRADPAGTLLALPPATVQQITVVAEDSTGRTSQTSTQVRTLPDRIGVCERLRLPTVPTRSTPTWTNCAPDAGEFRLFVTPDPGYGITVPVYRQASQESGEVARLRTEREWTWPSGGTWYDGDLLGYATASPAPGTEPVHRWERASGVGVYLPDRLDPNRADETFHRTGTIHGAR